MRDERTKKAFIAYLTDPEHRDWRFWQCVLGFSRFSCILGAEAGSAWDIGDLPAGVVDTFMIEADRGDS